MTAKHQVGRKRGWPRKETCRALIPLHTKKIRAEYLNVFKRRKKALEKLEAELLRYDENDEPEFQKFLAREEVGVSGSEGPFDFMASEMDYVFYVIFFDKPLPPFCDEKIPLWFLVYHGILGYNATCETADSALSPEGEAFLEQVEFGGHPLAYFYSKFLSTGYNWMGKGSDRTADSDGEMRDCVAKIKAEYDH